MPKPSIRIDFHGPSGNAFVIIAKAVSALEANGDKALAATLRNRLRDIHSYNRLLEVIREYVDIESVQ